MDDLISRQAAIDAIGEKPFAGTGDEYDYEQGLQNQWERDVVAIKILPPAQPEHLTDDDFETIRIHLSAFKESLCNQGRWKEAEDYERLISRFMSFASAQSKTAQNISDGDLVSRKDAIAHLKKRLIETAINNVGAIARCDSIFGDTADNRIGPWLNELPSAQPEREKGHWISKMRLFAGKEYMQCSKCGYILALQCLVAYPYFCPGCGAEMREDKP